ncbi:hypothetical protein QYE76_068080 [Lolium multiflorum]|uniref:Macro domain-containing protein n=1 Tax=Lolium multiflorum TaxID=4521 RepID=A0AAD8SDT5_LOLMU|nr:hypothetical protein QYE76_068080 [Lolium multiflorum]
MAAAGFEGGETFRLSAAAGAGALKLHKGDITLWSVDGATDAIVCASAPSHDPNPTLYPPRRAVFLYIKLLDHNLCKHAVKFLRAFELPVSRVIHTVGPVYDMDKRPELLLKNAYENSLKLAKENGIQYIAFPAISCGIFRYPPKEASNIAISTARQFSGDIKEVHFVLFTDELYNVWRETAQEMLAQFEK